MAQVYIKDGMLQSDSLMSRELAGKCHVECAPLSLPSNANNAGTGKATTNFPFDYYSTSFEITYPDKNKDKGFYLPSVIIYNSPRAIGNTTRYPIGFARGFVSYFEPLLKRGYDATVFGDRRFSQTPEYVWAESRNYEKDENNKSGIEVSASRIVNGKKTSIAFSSLAEAFQRAGSPALRVNLTCSIKLQAQVTKGKEIEPNTEARPVITPSKITILGKMDIAEPVVNTGRKSQTNEKDNADESFMEMLVKDSQDDDEEEEDEDEED